MLEKDELHEFKQYPREEIIAVLRDLNMIVVSLARLGSCAHEFDPQEQNQMLDDFISDWDVFRKLAKMRRILSAQFSDELGDDDMDELERECEDLEYWSLSKRKPSQIAPAAQMREHGDSCGVAMPSRFAIVNDFGNTVV